MHTRRVPYLVILGIVLMLTNILVNARTKKTSTIANSVVQKPQVISTAERNIPETSQSTLPFISNTPGVTILGIKKEYRRTPPAPKSPAQENTPVSAGVTKENKTITPSAEKEMNAKGIIIF